MSAASQVNRALRRLEHWLKQARTHLLRMEGSPKALTELDRLAVRLRLEIYEREGHPREVHEAGGRVAGRQRTAGSRCG